MVLDFLDNLNILDSVEFLYSLEFLDRLEFLSFYSWFDQMYQLVQSQWSVWPFWRYLTAWIFCMDWRLLTILVSWHIEVSKMIWPNVPIGSDPMKCLEKVGCLIRLEYLDKMNRLVSVYMYTGMSSKSTLVPLDPSLTTRWTFFRVKLVFECDFEIS